MPRSKQPCGFQPDGPKTKWPAGEAGSNAMRRTLPILRPIRCAMAQRRRAAAFEPALCGRDSRLAAGDGCNRCSHRHIRGRIPATRRGKGQASLTVWHRRADCGRCVIKHDPRAKPITHCFQNGQACEPHGMGFTTVAARRTPIHAGCSASAWQCPGISATHIALRTIGKKRACCITGCVQ